MPPRSEESRPADEPRTLSGITQYIANVAFKAYSAHIGQELTPSLAGQLAVEVARLVEPELAEAITHDFSELPVRLIGVGEAADLLGVSKQRVHQLARDKEAFPEPVARLRATPVWNELDIVRFKAEHRK